MPWQRSSETGNSPRNVDPVKDYRWIKTSIIHRFLIKCHRFDCQYYYSSHNPPCTYIIVKRKTKSNNLFAPRKEGREGREKLISSIISSTFLDFSRSRLIAWTSSSCYQAAGDTARMVVCRVKCFSRRPQGRRDTSCLSLSRVRLSGEGLVGQRSASLPLPRSTRILYPILPSHSFANEVKRTRQKSPFWRSIEGGGRGCNSKFIGMFLFFGGKLFLKKGTFEARSRCIKDERRGWSARPRHSKHARWNFSCTRRPTRSVLDANKKSRLWRDKDRRILVDSPRLETFRYIYIYIHPRTISRKFLTSPVFVVCVF